MHTLTLPITFYLLKASGHEKDRGQKQKNERETTGDYGRFAGRGQPRFVTVFIIFSSGHRRTDGEDDVATKTNIAQYTAEMLKCYSQSDIRSVFAPQSTVIPRYA